MTLRNLREWQRPPASEVEHRAQPLTGEQVVRWAVQAVRHGGLPAIALFSFHVIAAIGFEAYVRFPRLDIPMHFLGGAVIAYFFHRAAIAASSHGIIGSCDRTTRTVLIFALACVATVFWEFAEFVGDRFFGTHAQLGLDDTLGDMCLGICGGITFIIVNHWRAQKLCLAKQPTDPL